MQSARGAAIDVAGLGKRYESGAKSVLALADVTFAVEAGSVVGVMGPSGSGKSTLLHLIGAMDAADEGRIRVGDHAVTSLARREQAEYRRRIGFVFQRFHLLPALTALDNVAAPLLPHRVDFDKRQRAEALLGDVGLGDRADALPAELSGGEQQRVAIARALVNDPIVLIADEPTGNLDSQTGSEIMELIVALQAEHGMTVLVATHDAVVASFCERIIRLRDGRVLDELSVPRDVDTSDVLKRISGLDAIT
ncbi:MAG TPA: ABC transporter ATP-binding protein [Gaiellaceae bacterium]|nr:ABC transporter ATP-binding protein [Gaiellaceae bacterium]